MRNPISPVVIERLTPAERKEIDDDLNKRFNEMVERRKNSPEAFKRDFFSDEASVKEFRKAVDTYKGYLFNEPGIGLKDVLEQQENIKKRINSEYVHIAELFAEPVHASVGMGLNLENVNTVLPFSESLHLSPDLAKRITVSSQNRPREILPPDASKEDKEALDNLISLYVCARAGIVEWDEYIKEKNKTDFKKSVFEELEMKVEVCIQVGVKTAIQEVLLRPENRDALLEAAGDSIKKGSSAWQDRELQSRVMEAQTDLYLDFKMGRFRYQQDVDEMEDLLKANYPGKSQAIFSCIKRQVDKAIMEVTGRGAFSNRTDKDNLQQQI